MRPCYRATVSSWVGVIPSFWFARPSQRSTFFHCAAIVRAAGSVYYRATPLVLRHTGKRPSGYSSLWRRNRQSGRRIRPSEYLSVKEKPLPQGAPGGVIGILGGLVAAGLIICVAVTVFMVYRRQQKTRTETDNDLIAVADSCVAQAPEKPDSPTRKVPTPPPPPPLSAFVEWPACK
ncbi:hypothetical protein SKAU_G00086780 [Synaphobranchus kaupii]|uniref:Uncharacterized protein n=1 Tax=Synaphobranchus kaupii TaxID=118154 RepID=A0A9Q1FWR9_SYNKA|nr:hypothetical protein SKAU_G00086780 [Synaphobranchus kaupii]